MSFSSELGERWRSMILLGVCCGICSCRKDGHESNCRGFVSRSQLIPPKPLILTLLRSSIITDLGRLARQEMPLSKICSHLWGRVAASTDGMLVSSPSTISGMEFCTGLLVLRHLDTPVLACASRATQPVPIRRALSIGPQGEIRDCSCGIYTDNYRRNPSAATHSLMASYVEQVLSQCQSST